MINSLLLDFFIGTLIGKQIQELYDMYLLLEVQTAGTDNSPKNKFLLDNNLIRESESGLAASERNTQGDSECGCTLMREPRGCREQESAEIMR